MNERATLDAYGMLTEPAMLKIQRLLPGPIERVWAYLTAEGIRPADTGLTASYGG